MALRVKPGGLPGASSRFARDVPFVAAHFAAPAMLVKPQFSSYVVSAHAPFLAAGSPAFTERLSARALAADSACSVTDEEVRAVPCARHFRVQQCRRRESHLLLSTHCTIFVVCAVGHYRRAARRGARTAPLLPLRGARHHLHRAGLPPPAAPALVGTNSQALLEAHECLVRVHGWHDYGVHTTRLEVAGHHRGCAKRQRGRVLRSECTDTPYSLSLRLVMAERGAGEGAEWSIEYPHRLVWMGATPLRSGARAAATPAARARERRLQRHPAAVHGAASGCLPGLPLPSPLIFVPSRTSPASLLLLAISRCRTCHAAFRLTLKAYVFMHALCSGAMSC